MSTDTRKTGYEVNIPGFTVGHGYSLLETMTVIVVILTLPADLFTGSNQTWQVEDSGQWLVVSE